MASSSRTIMGAGHKMMAWMLPFLLAGVVTWVLGSEWARVPVPAPLWWLGAALTGFGVLGYGWSASDILRSFRAKRLLTSGSFGLCRHPLYATWLLLLLPGLALLSGNVGFVLAELGLIVGYLRHIGEEEQELVDEFGQDYRDYAATHRGLLPLGPSRGRAPTAPVGG